VLGVAQTSVMLLTHIDTPPYFTDASTDGLVCIHYVEESEFTAGPDWLEFVMRKSFQGSQLYYVGKGCALYHRLNQ